MHFLEEQTVCLVLKRRGNFKRLWFCQREEEIKDFQFSKTGNSRTEGLQKVISYEKNRGG